MRPRILFIPSRRCGNTKERMKISQSGELRTGEFAVGDLFVVKSNPQLNKESFKFTNTGEYPYFTRTVFNNGILSIRSLVEWKDREITATKKSIASLSDDVLAVGVMSDGFISRDTEEFLEAAGTAAREVGDEYPMPSEETLS